MSIFDQINKSDKLFLIAGPCVIESADDCMAIAGHLAALCGELGITYIFKSSFRKANRTRLDSFTGIGDQKALEILGKVRYDLKIPVLTDVHSEEDVEMATPYTDILQIPAFLSRQTKLLQKAGASGLPVNIKKGQFLHASSMEFALEKVASTGNLKIMVTERGNSFGYGDLIVDFRNIPIMKRLGCPVILDGTHSVQQPNTSAGVTGGTPEYIRTLVRAGVAAGVDGLFLETHPEPAKAASDGANMLPLDAMSDVLQDAVKLFNLVREMDR